jgi:hypothetical protein
MTLGAGAASATPDTVTVGESCTYTFSYGGATVTVRCGTVEPGNQFYAIARCPSGDFHYGPWVLQGAGHVSVAKCANPMIGWGAGFNG